MFIDAMTSSAPKDLPLWNFTPLRRLKVQILASGDASQLSASSPTSSPAEDTSVRVSNTQPAPMLIMKLSEWVRLSQVSDVLPPDMPMV